MLRFKPMSYDGGKKQAGVYQRIINQMPPHLLYVEGCLGAGAVMLTKRPAAKSLGIEIDREVLQSRWTGSEVPGLSLLCDNVIHWLKDASELLTPRALVYLDPPYLMSTRRSQRPLYRYEMADCDHRNLLKVALSLKCMVMISGYWSPMYAGLLRGWRAISFEVMTRGGVPATEWLWMNFPEPVELHDYRYVGEGWRERERIKKKVSRWKDKLSKMPLLERQALLAALAEFDAGREAGSRLAISDDVAGSLAEHGEAAR
ncbi:MAG TPA: DNA adenine methylase [Blastocatellia bacterium]